MRLPRPGVLDREVLRLDGDTYRIVASASGDDKARIEPIDAIELDVSILWAQ